MAIDENTRLDLRRAFEELIGPELANAAMEAMPPLDYNQLATKTDVENSALLLRSEMAGLRTKLHTGLADVRAEFRAEFADVRAELAGLRTELKDETTSLRGETNAFRADLNTMAAAIEFRMAKNLRTTVLTQVGTMAALAGIITGLG